MANSYKDDIAAINQTAAVIKNDLILINTVMQENHAALQKNIATVEKLTDYIVDSKLVTFEQYLPGINNNTKYLVSTKLSTKKFFWTLFGFTVLNLALLAAIVFYLHQYVHLY